MLRIWGQIQTAVYETPMDEMATIFIKIFFYIYYLLNTLTLLAMETKY